MNSVTKKKPLPRLTLKAARALAMRELGTAAGLERDEFMPDEISSYAMKLGELTAQIDNDWYFCSGLIRIRISSSDGQQITKLFKPGTLERVELSEWKRREAARDEDFLSRVFEIGLDGCKRILESGVTA